MWNSARCRTSGMHRSTARQRTSARSSLYASYSGVPEGAEEIRSKSK
jgi:hypothetical protein